MHCFKRHGLMSLLSLALASCVQAEGINLDSGYNNAFLHYRPYVKAGTPASAPKAAPVPSAKASPERASTVDVKWLQQNYPMLLERAINHPSRANAEAYLYGTRIILDRSTRFMNAVQDAVEANPLLNENNRIPLASLGAQSVTRANILAQQAAVRSLAKTAGLLIFVDSSCRFCAMQMPIIKSLRQGYGLEAMVISLDGKALPGYQGPMTQDNGLWRKLNLKLTPSIVLVNQPRGYQGGRDPNQYLVVAQGFYAESDLVKQIAYAGFRQNLLDASLNRALDVWNIGVASSRDLEHLQLNPDDPASFKQVLDPILLKQYR